MIYTTTRVTKINSDNHTNRSVNEITTLQRIMRRDDEDADFMNGSFKNLIHKNWLPITILLVLLSCIVLSFTYCQPTFIRIQETFVRIARTYFS